MVLDPNGAIATAIKLRDWAAKKGKRRTSSLDDVLVLNWGGSAPYFAANRSSRKQKT
jgi:hypothetical protein